MRDQDTYDELIRHVREQSLLASCSALLGWDENTYMPPNGAEHRGEQLALLAGMHHAKATDPKVGELLGTLEASDLVHDVDSPEAVNIREVRRDYDRLTKLPRSLVEELARTTSIAQREWSIARRESDFARLSPWLEAIIGLKRREAECVGFTDTAYDALLDTYEPGATARGLLPMFESLAVEIPPLLFAVVGASRQPDPKILARDFPIERQRVFGETVAAAIGFDFDAGRIDVTPHPFCSTIGPGDCRVATRFETRDFGDGFFSTLHEVGHALYEQGTDPSHFGTPMGEPTSLGIHESQSRLWENTVGRGLPFWQFWFPQARRVFHDAFRGIKLDDFHFAVNRVQTSLIRTEADEVTYNLHVLIRFELEQALLSGDLAIADLPDAWNAAYRRYLGIAPSNDAEGCLQDIHWSAGLFGYFPTYTLGNLFAAQLFARAREELGSLDEQFASGQFAELLNWLRDRVHRHGRRYRSTKLVERATGSTPSVGPLLAGLHEKYGPLYGL
jgi:carboxypeptidase Taq